MPPVRRRRIVLYGDSLTQRSFEPYGFGAELVRRRGDRERARETHVMHACSPVWRTDDASIDDDAGERVLANVRRAKPRIRWV